MDKNAAIAMCAYEIFEMLGYSLGLTERVNRAYKKFASYLEYRSDFVDQTYMEQNGILLSHIGKFADMGGFNSFKDLLNSTDDFKCPIPVMNMAARIVYKLRDISLKVDFYKMLSGNFAKLIEDRLSAENLTGVELKEVNLEELKECGKYMAFFKNQSQETDFHQVSEIMELEFAKRFLCCPFFEKRIKGMQLQVHSGED